MYMPALIFFAVLDREQKSSFMDRHYLTLLVISAAILSKGTTLSVRPC